MDQQQPPPANAPGPNGGTNPPFNNNNNNNNNVAELRLIVNSLVSEVKDKQELIGTKNDQITDMLNRLKLVNQRLSERDNTIDELKKKLDGSVPEQIIDFDTLPEGVVFPSEVFDVIFRHSCASTRVNLAATNKFFHQRFHQWKDVTSVYISRQPIKQLPRATIIPQTYLIRTNVPAVASFSCSSLTSMAPTLFYAKQMLIESVQNRILTECNRIPPQRGFFGQFKNLEYLKIANVLDNLSIRYDLKELLGLPFLKVLHIRDIRTNFTLPDPKEIAAPIEQLRISIAYRNHDKLVPFLEALSPTLTSLDFTSLRNFSPINTVVGGELIPAVTSKCTELVELHIPNIVSKHATFDSTIPLLKNLTKLKRISFEVMHLTSLVNIIENLPPSCDSLIVTDVLYMNNGEMIGLTHAGVNEKLFNGTNLENLQFQCNRIHRNFILQFGRLRGSHPKFLIRDITLSIQIIINASFEPRRLSNPHDRRIYLTDGVVLTREEFLNQMGILPAEEF